MILRPKLVDVAILISVSLAILCVSCVYAEWAAKRAAQRSQQEDFEYWRGKLMPFYEATPGLIYNKDPKTKEELFDPLFEMTTPVR